MSNTPHTPARASGIKGWILGTLLGVLGTAALTGWTHSHSGGAGLGGPEMFLGNPERTARRVDHMLDGVGASDAQRAQIKQIVQAAAADLKAQHQAAGGLRAQSLQLLTAPVIDANAVEVLRQQMLAQHDQASRRISQALVDVANALTPEQRAKLGQRLQQRAAQMHERMQRAGSQPTQ